MNQYPRSLVMKFGGAAVSSPEKFARIADIIIERSQHYSRLVIVVSAMGDMTNKLIELAKKVNPDPPKREYDMLLTVGERFSISLLAMALAGKNKHAESFTGSQSGIITCSRHTEARIIEIRPHRIQKCLEMGKIAIVAGFQGVSKEGNITTLGRGGSDTTAVALGIALQAECVEFFKDVKGIYDKDPKKYSEAVIFTQMTYDQALEIANQGAKILSPRCIELAKKNLMLLKVLSFNEEYFKENTGTIISDGKHSEGDSVFIKKNLYEEEFAETGHRN